jgi:DNA (cytosine-5)-methyltransferase 1
LAQGETTPKKAATKVDITESTADLDRLDERAEPSGVGNGVGSFDVLNLYAGIGGNRRLWGDEVNVTAVERDPEIADIYRNEFPQDTVVEADAHQYLLDHIKEFDFIWSSPPCPTHGQMEAINHEQHSVRYPDMGLYAEIILLKNRADQFGYEYCVENVVGYYDPLVEPQKIDRHYYWASADEIPKADTPTLRKRGSESRVDAVDAGAGFDYERHQKVLGFDLSEYDVSRSKKGKALRNCVTPEQGKEILDAVVEGEA